MRHRFGPSQAHCGPAPKDPWFFFQPSWRYADGTFEQGPWLDSEDELDKTMTAEPEDFRDEHGFVRFAPPLAQPDRDPAKAYVGAVKVRAHRFGPYAETLEYWNGLEWVPVRDAQGRRSKSPFDVPRLALVVPLQVRRRRQRKVA